MFLSIMGRIAWGAPIEVRIDDLRETVFYTVLRPGVLPVIVFCSGEMCLDQQITVTGNIRRAIVGMILKEPFSGGRSDDFLLWSVGRGNIAHFCFTSDSEGSPAAQCPLPAGFPDYPAARSVAE